MFLRNYDNLMVGTQIAKNSAVTTTCTSSTYSYANIIGTSTTDVGDGFLNGVTPGGTTVLFTSNRYINSSSSNYSHGWIPALPFSAKSLCLGNGSTEVDYEDNKLSGEVVTNKLTETSNELAYDAERGSWKRTLVASYANSGGTDITISEWGIFRPQGTADVVTYSNSSTSCVLLFREVLAEPIVIKAGTTAELTFTVEIPMPNHP